MSCSIYSYPCVAGICYGIKDTLGNVLENGYTSYEDAYADSQSYQSQGLCDPNQVNMDFYCEGDGIFEVWRWDTYLFTLDPNQRHVRITNMQIGDQIKLINRKYNGQYNLTKYDIKDKNGNIETVCDISDYVENYNCYLFGKEVTLQEKHKGGEIRGYFGQYVPPPEFNRRNLIFSIDGSGNYKAKIDGLDFAQLKTGYSSVRIPGVDVGSLVRIEVLNGDLVKVVVNGVSQCEGQTYCEFEVLDSWLKNVDIPINVVFSEPTPSPPLPPPGGEPSGQDNTIIIAVTVVGAALLLGLASKKR